MCVEAEIALASRDLSFPAKTLDAARVALEEHGDRLDAAHARYLEIRRLLLIGASMRRSLTSRTSIQVFSRRPSRTAHELVLAGIAMPRLRTKRHVVRWQEM